MGIGQKNTKRRQKTCRHCKKKFRPERDFQSTCSIECSIEYGKIKAKKAMKQQRTQMRKEFKENDKSAWAKKAQSEFNKYIRLRDRDKPCISCGYIWGENNHQRQAHASHYISVGASKHLRFNEDNVHKSCQQCNTFMSGNISNYRIKLIDKIGLEKVEWLEREAKNPEPCKRSVDDYKNIVQKYKLKNKAIENML